jgi:hypothetical protein
MVVQVLRHLFQVLLLLTLAVEVVAQQVLITIRLVALVAVVLAVRLVGLQLLRVLQIRVEVEVAVVVVQV